MVRSQEKKKGKGGRGKERGKGRKEEKKAQSSGTMLRTVSSTEPPNKTKIDMCHKVYL